MNRELLWSIHAEPFFETGTVVWVAKERCEVGVGKTTRRHIHQSEGGVAVGRPE